MSATVANASGSERCVCLFRVFSVSFPCLFRVIPWQILMLILDFISVANLLLSCNFRPNMDILEML